MLPLEDEERKMVEDWSKLDKEVLYTWLTGVLKEGSIKITFQKKDGSERVMLATLKEEVVPKYEKKTDREKTKTQETMSVFDLEKEEWRSFRLDSLKQIEFSLG